MTSAPQGKRALITGITGQDGSFLAEQLLSKGYEVYGMVRRLSTPNTQNIHHIVDRIHLVDGDLHDQASLESAVRRSEPDEIYNLAAQSFVGVSFNQPVVTGEVTGLGAVRMLEAMRSRADKARFYQASSSEMFGKVVESPQTERTPFYPRSPYGVAKVYAYWACVNYRESYGLHVSNGILYNHESERRGMEFLTRKVSDGVARIKLGHARTIRLGTLETHRDWGYAPEYTEMMWRMLQQPTPNDFIGATGEAHSVREFVDLAFRHVGIPDWSKHVELDPRFARPADVDHLLGNASKAREKLGWVPKVKFADLVRIMVDADIRRWANAASGPEKLVSA
ncbi:MAG: GDP-mannose 4,6-dehydratase [Euryarchaeota archaeon]|nr:GDP-mannose 4,6-dehydratase [Euryarchaeota archaeon]MDE1835775.1 GDP-mannose 4,6-dehydratase [Euryarchaeota archaeon]MDE1881550.1 GDP-mannose 4,6-dehydratase [Euryarchaeota archaeon]MDE2043966.1 GDP-mannose 4,6-dehydratase [Thermoplasmata archaeon]